MIIKLKELQGRMADQGKRVSLEEIAKATGIGVSAIYDMTADRLKILRPEYVDALCSYFCVTAGELVASEPVELPLPAKRPDRRGKRIGTRTQESEG